MMSSLPSQVEASPAPPAAGARRDVAQQWMRTIVGGAAVAAFLTVWQIVGGRELARSDLVSYPSEILASLYGMIASGELAANLGITLQEFVLGFVPAIVFGVALGVAFALSRRLVHLVDPIFAALYTAPMIAFIPILVVWFGVGMATKAVMVFLTAFVPIVINTRTGVAEVNEAWVRALRAYGATRAQVIFKGLLPGATPAIMAGLRLAVGRSIVSLVAAEMYVSVKGIGRLVQVYSTSDRAAAIFVLVLVISSLGFAGVVFIRMLEAWIAPWSASR
jgi:ABC-type nitrate/sulfonate/bicarbonate transport system permease component